MFASSNTILTILEVKFNNYFRSELNVGSKIGIELLETKHTFPSHIHKVEHFKGELQITSRVWTKKSDFSGILSIRTHPFDLTLIDCKQKELELRLDKIKVLFDISNNYNCQVFTLDLDNKYKIFLKLL